MKNIWAKHQPVWTYQPQAFSTTTIKLFVRSKKEVMKLIFKQFSIQIKTFRSSRGGGASLLVHTKTFIQNPRFISLEFTVLKQFCLSF